jgi:hypothetical protein
MCGMLVLGTFRYYQHQAPSGTILPCTQTLWVEKERGWIVSQHSHLNTHVLDKLTFKVDKLVISNIISLQANNIGYEYHIIANVTAQPQ